MTYKSCLRDTSAGVILTFYGMDGSAEIAIVNFGNDCVRFSEALKVNCVLVLYIFLIINYINLGQLHIYFRKFFRKHGK